MLSDQQAATPDDDWYKEWAECRAIIGRLDLLLVDLRKTGFAFITALLTASAFLSLLGVPGSQTGSATPIQARGIAFMAIMVLIAALFAVDNYYEVLLNAAVERALDLESQSDPPVRVTKYLSINASSTLSTWVLVGLYLILLATAGGLGLFAVAGTTAKDGSFTWSWNSWADYVVRIGLVLGAAMTIYWVFVTSKTNLHRFKPGRHWGPDEGPTDKNLAPRPVDGSHPRNRALGQEVSEERTEE